MIDEGNGPIAIQLQRICHDTLPWLISISLGVMTVSSLTTRKTYVSAAGKDWLLPFYDLFTKLLGVEAVHGNLIRQAAISPGHRVLEIGCGTDNLAILAKRLNPAAQVVGIDPTRKPWRRPAERRNNVGPALQFDLGCASRKAVLKRRSDGFVLRGALPEESRNRRNATSSGSLQRRLLNSKADSMCW
jgi:SAM-dependent methyltransferase